MKLFKTKEPISMAEETITELKKQIEELHDFITNECDGHTDIEGACHAAIRIIKELSRLCSLLSVDDD